MKLTQMKKKFNYITPIQPLSEMLNNNEFYMKRDDLFPLAFGGNKSKKALYFLSEFDKGKYKSFVTYGSSSSNHCRVIANIAAQRNVKCYIISPLENKIITSNSKITTVLGAEIIYCKLDDVKATIDGTILSLEDRGEKPYFIQGGGHGNLGTAAYVETFDEIIKFENENEITFDYIFHTSGTGTTQAGLICGNLLRNTNKEIIGVSNARRNPYGQKVILESIKEYFLAANLDEPKEIKVSFIDDYVLDGYGSFNKEVIETMKKVLVNDGISLDKTYTGKAYWGMLEYIKNENITNKKILFIHTGGTPLFYDDLEEMAHATNTH